MRQKKKILIFSTAYYPFVGGAEVAVKEITERLGADFEFDMITARLDSKIPKQEKIGNVRVFRIGIGNKIIDKLWLAFFCHRLALKLYQQNNYDCVWAIMASYGGLSASKFIAKIKGRRLPSATATPKFLLTLQEGDSPEHIARRTRFIKKQFKNIFQRADYIQCISHYLAEWAKKMGALCPIEVIPNGVDTAHFSQIYPETELNELKKKLNKVNDKFLITTSRLVLKNACDDVIKVLKFLPKDIKFIILGEGPDRKMLEKLAETEGVANRVIFLGLINHDILPKYLRVADIFIRPSLSEGLGNSFLEAMAVGLPVIATQKGGIADFLFDAVKNPDKNATGWAVNPRDPRGIAEKVKDILDHPSKTAETVAAAKKMVFEKYDWSVIAKDAREKIFEKLMK